MVGTSWRSRLLPPGDGWARCSLGHRHWGTHGAAGLLVATDDGLVLLQHRAAWSHGGDTWGIPGGARRPDETAAQAALRETVEETRLDLTGLRLVDRHVADHGSWTYVTHVGRLPTARPVVLERESADLRWVPVSEVAGFDLHPAFGDAWSELSKMLQ